MNIMAETEWDGPDVWLALEYCGVFISNLRFLDFGFF